MQSACQCHFRSELYNRRTRMRTVLLFLFGLVTALSGFAQQPVSLSRISLNFGPQKQSTTSPSQTTTLTNDGAGPLTLSFLITGANAGDFAISNNGCGGSLAAGANCTVTLTFTPTTTGQRTASLSINDGSSNSPQQVRLFGVGTPTTGPTGAKVSLSNVLLNFGVQTVGQTSAFKTVTLTNTGDATLTGINISAGGIFAQTSIYPPPNYNTFLPPAVLGSYADPVFGTTIKRISNALGTVNADGGGNLTWITDEYATMTPFNHDNSRIILVHQSYFGLYDGSGSFIGSLPLEINALSEPRWSRSDANVLYYHSGNKLKSYNVSTLATTTVHTFSEYTSITARGESDISYDGNHFVLAGDDRYVFVYTISTDTKGPVFDTNVGGAWDSVYISPDNNVLIAWIASGTVRYRGGELFDQNMNFLRQITDANGHKHMTRDTDGSEVLIWNNSDDPTPIPNCQNGIVKIKLADATQTCLLQLDFSLAVHISAADNAGYAWVETYAPSNPDPSTSAWKAYTNEIVQVKLDGTEVRRLLHHRSRPLDSYNFQPRVSVSRDGSRFVYNSNYDLQVILGHPMMYADVYLVLLSGANSINTCGSTLVASGTCTIGVTFTPNATGPFRGLVTIINSAAGSPHAIRLFGTGNPGAVPAIGFSSVSVDFGNQANGTTSTAKTVTVTNTGNATLTITNVAASGDFAVSGCVTSLSIGSTCTLNITFTPTTTGRRRGTVALTDNASGSPQVIRLFGNGT